MNENLRGGSNKGGKRKIFLAQPLPIINILLQIFVCLIMGLSIDPNGDDATYHCWCISGQSGWVKERLFEDSPVFLRSSFPSSLEENSFFTLPLQLLVAGFVLDSGSSHGHGVFFECSELDHLRESGRKEIRFCMTNDSSSPTSSCVRPCCTMMTTDFLL